MSKKKDGHKISFWFPRISIPGVLLYAISVIILFMPSTIFSFEEEKVELPPANYKDNLNIEIKNDRLFLNATNVDLTAVLRKISEKSNIPIIFGEGLDGRVSIQLKNVTIEEALRQLSKNYALVYERLPGTSSYRIVKIGAFATDTTVVKKNHQKVQNSRKADNNVRKAVSSRSSKNKLALKTEKTTGHPLLDRKGRRRYIPGELLVKFKPGVTEKEVNQLHRAMDSQIIGKISRMRLQRIQLKQGLTEIEAIDRYLSSGLVEIAEKNALRYSNETVPNDPYFQDQWGMQKIQAPEAWDLNRGSSDVIIAIIDTGVDYHHPDLEDNIWVNRIEADGIEGIDDDGNGKIDDICGYDFADEDADPVDVYGHGTHIAGVIAAKGNNGMGIAGLNWSIQIMPLKVQADNASEIILWDVLQAIDYAIENGAMAVNCSFGGEERSVSEENSFNKLKSNNILAVCAAGNDGLDIDVEGNESYPASYPLENILTVAAGDSNDALSGFSNYGLVSVDVMAPGQSNESGTGITSTAAATSSTEAFIQLGATRYDANGMTYAGTTDQNGISGLIIDCGKGYPNEFPQGISGYIALIERGSNDDSPFYFFEKTENAQNAGAIGVVIYNNINISENFYGSLSTPGQWVPVVSVTQSDGEALKQNQFQSITLYNRFNNQYTYEDRQGTSIATAFVTGIAGLILSSNPALNYDEIKSIILNSVEPISSVENKILSGGRVDAFTALSSGKNQASGNTDGNYDGGGNIGGDGCFIHYLYPR